MSNLTYSRDKYKTAEQIALALTAPGKRPQRTSGGWICQCPHHPDKTPSLSVRDGEKGPLIFCHAGCDSQDVISALQALYLWPQRGEHVEWKPPPDKPRKPERDRSALPRQIWTEATDPRGTDAERYLCHRGLILPDDIANSVVRFHPRTPFGPGTKLPCLIARFSPILNDYDEAPSAILRIRLDRFSGPNRKLSLGATRGQAIKLCRDVEKGIGLAEGLETSLAVLQSGWAPIWACGSSFTVKSFPVLSGIECLSLFADHDMPGFEAAQTCAERWLAAGREVFIRWTDKVGSDFADEVMR